MTIKNIKEIKDTDGKTYMTLLCHNTPLKKLIKSYKRADIFKEHTQKIDELFMGIETEKGRFYYYIIPTTKFFNLILNHLFTYIGMILFIQQVKVSSKEKTFLDEFMIVVEEAEMIGNIYIDYKPKSEVFKFFKLEKLKP